MSYKISGSETYYKVQGTESYYKITNVTDRTAPVLLSAVIPADGLSIVLTYNEALDETSVPIVSDFGISNVAGIVVDSVNILDDEVTLGISGGTFTDQDEPKLYYTAGSNPFQDDYGNECAKITAYNVTNNSEVTP